MLYLRATNNKQKVKSDAEIHRPPPLIPDNSGNTYSFCWYLMLFIFFFKLKTKKSHQPLALEKKT